MADKPKNKVELEGEIMVEPKPKYLPNGTAKVWCILNAPEMVKGEQKDNKIPLTLFGDRAEEFANQVRKGDHIRVTNGKVSARRYKSGDVWKDDISVLVFNWELAEGAPRREMGSELGAGLSFTDDDDVPFTFEC